MNLEKHHIVFKKQGGLDFDINYKYLSPNDHRGNESPHFDRSIDLRYKKAMEQELRDILPDSNYSIDELIQILGLKEKQAYKAFKRLIGINGIDKEKAIFRLMGDRFYLGVD